MRRFMMWIDKALILVQNDYHSIIDGLSSIISTKGPQWDAKYSKPSSGIPKADLASSVQASLSNADTAYNWGNHASAGYLTSVPDGSITTAKLKGGAVTTAKIAYYAVTDDELADYAVTTRKIDDGAVTQGKLDSAIYDKISSGVTAYGWGNHANAGYTKNTGTVTSVAVKINGSVKGTVTSSGTIDLGTGWTKILSLGGEPTPTTPGEAGMLYMGGTSSQSALYLCVGKTGQYTYTWAEIKVDRFI